MASIPQYVTGSAFSGSGTAGTVNVTIPSTVPVGSILVMAVAWKAATATGTINTPTGWSVIRASTGSGAATYQGACFIRVAAAGVPGSTIAVSASSLQQQINVAGCAYANALVTPRNNSWTSTASASTSISIPSATANTGDLIVYWGTARQSVNGPSGHPTFTGTDGTVRAQSANTSGSAQNVAAFVGDHNDVTGAKAVTASTTVWTMPGQIVLQPATLVGTLTDDFDDNSVNATKWPDSYGSPVESGGRARVPAVAAGWASYVSAASYQLTNSALFARIYPPANTGATSSYAQLGITTTTSGTAAAIGIDSATNQIGFTSWVAWDDPGGVYETYNPATDAWGRIRESGGTLYFETSANGTSWTVRRSITTPSWAGNTNLAVTLEAHRDAGTTTYAEFDSFNIVPSIVEHDGTASLSAASGLTAGGTRIQPGATALSAASNLSAAAVRIQPGAVALDAASGLTAGGIQQAPGATALSAASALSAAATRIQPAAAALSAASNLNVAAMATRQAGAALSAASGLTAGALQQAPGMTALSAATGLAAGAVTLSTTTTALSASTGLTAAGLPVRVAAVALSAASALSGTAVPDRVAGAPLSAATGLNVAAMALRFAAAALDAATDLTAGSSGQSAAAADLSTTSGLSAGAIPIRPATAALSAGSELAAAAVRIQPGATALSAASTLSAGAVRDVPGLAALSAASGLNVAGLATLQALATLSAASGLSGTGQADRFAGAALSAGSGLTAAGVRPETGTALLTARSTLVAAQGSGGGAAPESLFQAGIDEPAGSFDDGTALALAVTVHFPLGPGTITHIRFRMPDSPTGTYQGLIYEITGSDAESPSGTLLAGPVTFSSPVAGAYNEVAVPGGLEVQQGGPGGKIYRVVVHSSSGRYTARGGYFTVGGAGKASSGGAVHSPATGADPTGVGALYNGTYGMGPASNYPSSSFNAGNYYVDVVFQPQGGGALEHGAAANLSAESGLLVSGEATAAGAVVLSAATGLELAAPLRAVPGTVLLSAVSGLTASAVRAVAGAVAMSAASGLQAAAVRQVTATVTLSAASGLSAEAGRAMFATAALTAVGELTVGALRETGATAALSAQADLTAGADQVALAGVLLGAVSDLLAGAETSSDTALQLSAGSALQVLPVAIRSGLAMLGAATLLTVAALRRVPGSAPLSAAAGLTVGAQGEIRAMVLLSGASGLTAVMGYASAATPRARAHAVTIVRPAGTVQRTGAAVGIARTDAGAPSIRRSG